MKKIFLLLLAVFLVGCMSISEIKSEEYVDKTVTVRGTVEGSIKLGDLSGYTLQDESESIFVSSPSLPEEGKEVTVKGTLKKSILGYYIET